MPEEKNINAKNYMDALKERSKTSKVYKKYQMTGLTLSEILEDNKHKALYIKLAKEQDEQKLMELAKKVAENKNVKNKGAYFMRLIHPQK
jgi:predicted RND superfamily exporter protein